MPVDEVRIVLSTVPDESVAASMAWTLVEERLAACVNRVSGVRSTYRWEGRICDETEVLLILKSSSSRVDALIARVKSLHPYAVPEILVVPVVTGHPSCVSWILQETAP